MHKKVYQSRIGDVDELCERIKAPWEELDQRILESGSGAFAFMHV